MDTAAAMAIGWGVIVTLPFATLLVRMPPTLRGIALAHPLAADLLVAIILHMIGGSSVAASVEFRLLLVTWVVMTYVLSFVYPRLRISWSGSKFYLRQIPRRKFLWLI